MKENKVTINKSCISLNKARSVGKELDSDVENVMFNNDHLSIWNEEKTTPKGKSLLEKRAGKMLVKTKRKIKEYAEKGVIGILTVIIDTKDSKSSDVLMDHIFEWSKRVLGRFQFDENVICIRKTVSDSQLKFEIYYVPIVLSGEKTYSVSEKLFWKNHESDHSGSWLEFTFFTDVILAGDHVNLNILDSLDQTGADKMNRLMMSVHNAFQLLNYKLFMKNMELADKKNDYESIITSLGSKLESVRNELKNATDELEFYKSASESLLDLPEYIHDNKDALLKGANVIIDIVKGSD